MTGKEKTDLGFCAVTDKLHAPGANAYLSRKQILYLFCTGPELGNHTYQETIYFRTGLQENL